MDRRDTDFVSMYEGRRCSLQETRPACSSERKQADRQVTELAQHGVERPGSCDAQKAEARAVGV